MGRFVLYYIIHIKNISRYIDIYSLLSAFLGPIPIFESKNTDIDISADIHYTVQVKSLGLWAGLYCSISYT